MIRNLTPPVAELLVQFVEQGLLLDAPEFFLHAAPGAFGNAHFQRIGCNKWGITSLAWVFFIRFFPEQVKVRRILLFLLGFQERNSPRHPLVRYFNIIN